MTPRLLPTPGLLPTPRLLATLGLLFLAAACGRGSNEPITKLVEPVDVKTGWFDAGVENNQNKLLPTITLTLKNVSTEPVANVQLNAVIRRVGETEEWGGAFRKAVGMEAIPPGGTSEPIVLRSNLGYTGSEP